VRQRLLLVKSLFEEATVQNHIQGLLNGHATNGPTDTGSDLTVLKCSVAEQMGQNHYRYTLWKRSTGFTVRGGRTHSGLGHNRSQSYDSRSEFRDP
jgi:hypothetical protein